MNENNNENQNNENTGADNAANTPETSTGTTGTGADAPNTSGVETPAEPVNTDASQQPAPEQTNEPAKEEPAEQPKEEPKTDEPAKEEGTASAEQVTVTFTGASKKTVEVARGSKLSEALKAAGIAQTTHSYRTAAGSDLSTTEAVNDNMTINVVKKANMG